MLLALCYAAPWVPEVTGNIVSGWQADSQITKKNHFERIFFINLLKYSTSKKVHKFNVHSLMSFHKVNTNKHLLHLYVILERITDNKLFLKRTLVKRISLSQ